MTASPTEKRTICVVGAGAFGTAMAYLAGSNGHRVRVFTRDPEQRDVINAEHRNPRYLEGECVLPETVWATCDSGEAMRGCEMVILALPAQKSVGWIAEHVSDFPEDAVVCSTAKGLYVETKQLLSKAMLAAFGGRHQRLAFLSGPSFAQYIVRNHPTAVVVASETLQDAVSVQFALSNKRFRVYASMDVVGVELGGALKNVLALGAGMIEGSGLSINTMAAFVTRAARELTVLCVAMGGRPETVAGLSGIGDLMLTAFGDLSRNRTCGVRLAKGETLQDILKNTTIEGIPTAEVAIVFAKKCNLDLPIFNAVHQIIQGTLSPRAALDTVMSRPLGTEIPLL